MSRNNPIGEVLEWLLNEGGQSASQRALMPHQIPEEEDLDLYKTIAEQLYPIMRGARPDPPPTRPTWTPEYLRQYMDHRDRQMPKIWNDPRYPEDYLQPNNEEPIAQRGSSTRLAGANPVQQALQMWTQMYPDEGDKRDMMGPNEGTPGPTNVNPAVTILRDSMQSKDERELGKKLIQQELLRRELDSNQITPQVGRSRGLTPEILRYFEQLPKDPNPRQRYLQPDPPDLEEHWKDYMPISRYQPGLLTRLAMMPNQPQINERSLPDEIIRNFDPGYRKSKIREWAPPDPDIDPQMEYLERRYRNAHPDSPMLKPLPGEMENDPLYDEDIDPQEQES